MSFLFEEKNRILLTNLLTTWGVIAQSNPVWNKIQENNSWDETINNPYLQESAWHINNFLLYVYVYRYILFHTVHPLILTSISQVIHIFSIVPGSLCPACIGWNPTSAYHESQSRLSPQKLTQLTWKTWKLITWWQRHSEKPGVSFGWNIYPPGN